MVIKLFLFFNWFISLRIFIIMRMILSWISRYVIWTRIHTIFWTRLDFVWLRCIIWLAISWYFICCSSIHIIWIRRRPWIYILSWNIWIVIRQSIISVRHRVFIVCYTSIFLRLYYVFFIFLVFMRVLFSFLKIITTLWKTLIKSIFILLSACLFIRHILFSLIYYILLYSYSIVLACFSSLLLNSAILCRTFYREIWLLIIYIGFYIDWWLISTIGWLVGVWRLIIMNDFITSQTLIIVLW
jgi:hypothetical protein